ncbi:MAG: EpsG family protein [Oscillospiraceae bacterium]|nr:EpsG family protein [Oscillospiraceae bacterium]
MLIYAILPFAVFIPGLILCREKFGKPGRIVYCIYFGLLTWAVSAVRYDVGMDYLSYKRIFEGFEVTGEHVNSSRLEKGYYMIQSILASRFDDYRIMFGLWAFIFSAAAAYWIYKNSSRPEVSATAFIMFGAYFYSMNFLRQVTAAFIVLYAMDCIKKNDFVRYVVMILFASCFHWSALILIPFYFILKIRLQPILLTVYFLLAGLLLTFSWDLIYIARGLWEGAGVKNYLSYLYETSMEMKFGVFLFYLFGYAMLFAFMFFFRRKLYEKDKMNIVYMSCMLFVVMFEFWGAKHAILSRFALYFVLPSILGLLPDALTAAEEWAKTKIRQKFPAVLSVNLVMLAIASFFFGSMIHYNGNKCMPYTTWLSFREPESYISFENDDAEFNDPEDEILPGDTAAEEDITNGGEYEYYSDEEFYADLEALGIEPKVPVNTEAAAETQTETQAEETRPAETQAAETQAETQTEETQTAE